LCQQSDVVDLATAHDMKQFAQSGSQIAAAGGDGQQSQLAQSTLKQIMTGVSHAQYVNECAVGLQPTQVPSQ
jgi:hypothetical protein